MKTFSFFSILSIFTLFCATGNALPEKPNIVYIMADDLGWSDVGYNGAKFYETPNIDKLRASGIAFTDAYSGASNCMPARACLMSGMYIPRTQMWTPGSRAKGETAYMKFLVPRRSDEKGRSTFPSKMRLKPAITSIAEILNPVGYKTARYGKWHLGANNQGFDISDSGGGKPGGTFYGKFDIAEKLTNKSVQFINKHKSEPFFLYLCHWDVHSPIAAQPEVVKKYQDKLAQKKWARKWNPTYAAMIEAVDTSVGRVMKAIENNGLTEKTLIIFTSDNGGDSGATWNTPLKGAKGAFYEGGIRVPTCMSWPGVIAPGSTSSTPITGVDLMPSLAEISGASLPEMQPIDGESWLPLLQGKEALSNRAIFWHFPLYLKGFNYNKLLPIQRTNQKYWRATPCSVIRKGDWKLIKFFENKSLQLYNLKDDLGETKDLSKTNLKKTKELHRLLKQWQGETKAIIPSIPNPDFAPPKKKK